MVLPSTITSPFLSCCSIENLKSNWNRRGLPLTTFSSPMFLFCVPLFCLVLPSLAMVESGVAITNARIIQVRMRTSMFTDIRLLATDYGLGEIHAHQEFRVGLGADHAADEKLHGFDGLHVA